jgi:hypothetical protein
VIEVVVDVTVSYMGVRALNGAVSQLVQWVLKH